MRFFLQIAGANEVEILKEFHVGRVEADLKFEDELLSATHAKFHIDQNVLYVTDLASSNGTLVNKNPIEKFFPHALSEGDEIEMGTQVFKVKVVAMEHTETKIDAAPSEGTVFEASIKIEDAAVEIAPQIAKEEVTQFEKASEATPTIASEETTPKVETKPISEESTQISEAPASIKEEVAAVTAESVPTPPAIEVISAPPPKPKQEAAPPPPPAPPVQKTSVNEVNLPPAASPTATVKIKKEAEVKVAPKVEKSKRPLIISATLGIVIIAAAGYFFKKNLTPPPAAPVTAGMPTVADLAAEAALVAADVASEAAPLNQEAIASESVAGETTDPDSASNSSEGTENNNFANSDIASESVTQNPSEEKEKQEVALEAPKVTSESVPAESSLFNETALLKQLETYKKDYLLADEFGIRSEIEILAASAIESHYSEIKDKIKADFKRKRSLASENNAPKDEELFQKILQVSQREKEAKTKLIDYLSGTILSIF